MRDWRFGVQASTASVGSVQAMHASNMGGHDHCCVYDCADRRGKKFCDFSQVSKVPERSSSSVDTCNASKRRGWKGLETREYVIDIL